MCQMGPLDDSETPNDLARLNSGIVNLLTGGDGASPVVCARALPALPAPTPAAAGVIAAGVAAPLASDARGESPGVQLACRGRLCSAAIAMEDRGVDSRGEVTAPPIEARRDAFFSSNSGIEKEMPSLASATCEAAQA